MNGTGTVTLSAAAAQGLQISGTRSVNKERGLINSLAKARSNYRGSLPVLPGGKLSRAIMYFDQAIEIDPVTCRCLATTVALLKGSSERDDEAFKSIDRLLNSKPDNDGVLFTRAEFVKTDRESSGCEEAITAAVRPITGSLS